MAIFLKEWYWFLRKLEIGFPLGKMPHFPKKHTSPPWTCCSPREWPFSSMNGIISLGIFFKFKKQQVSWGNGNLLFLWGGKKKLKEKRKTNKQTSFHKILTRAKHVLGEPS
jgi:hypothetical protein